MSWLRSACLQIRDSFCEAFGGEARARRDVVTEDTSEEEEGGENNAHDMNGENGVARSRSRGSSHSHQGNYVEVHLLRKELNERHHFPTNAIRTAKYTTCSALPLSLFSQFRKVSNCYFLLVMTLALVPGASPVNPYSSIVPFCIVLGAGILKDIWEDLKRQDADRKANAMAVQVLRDGQFAAVRSKEIYPGDLLLFRLGDEVKADCVVLNTSLPDGLTYIETSNLDGETNAKARRAKMYTIEHLGTVEDIVDCALHGFLPATSSVAVDVEATTTTTIVDGGEEGNNNNISSGAAHALPVHGETSITPAAAESHSMVYEVNDRLCVLPRPPQVDPGNELNRHSHGDVSPHNNGGREVRSAKANQLLPPSPPSQQLAHMTREEREAMRLAASGSYSQGLMLSPVFSYTRGEPHTRTMTIPNGAMSVGHNNNMHHGMQYNAHLRSASMSFMPSMHRRHLTFDEMLESRGELGMPSEIQDLSRRYELAHPRTHTSTTIAPHGEHPRSISAAASSPALVTMTMSSPLRFGTHYGVEGVYGNSSGGAASGRVSHAFQPYSPHFAFGSTNTGGRPHALGDNTPSTGLQTGLVMPFAAQSRQTGMNGRSVFGESPEVSHSPFKNTPFARTNAGNNSIVPQQKTTTSHGNAVLHAEECVDKSKDGRHAHKESDTVAVGVASAESVDVSAGATQASLNAPPPSVASALAESEGVVVLGSAPGPDLSAWFGQLRMADGTTVALGIDQFLPRGSIIRNTDWVLAVAMYTGPNTKMLLNLRPPLYKTTVMTRRLNQLNVFLFFINQMLMFLLCGLAVWWSKRVTRRQPGVRSGYTAWYIQYDLMHHRGFRLFWWRYLSNFVLLSYLIPLSLYVTLEFNKAMQMLMIAADRRMAVYDEFSDTLKKARPKTSELNCQLGQVEYIFTDKTGTLTENLMTYVGGQVGHFSHDERTKPGGVGQLFLGVLHNLQYSEAAMVLKRKLSLGHDKEQQHFNTTTIGGSEMDRHTNGGTVQGVNHAATNAAQALLVPQGQSNPMHEQSPLPLTNSAISRSMPLMTGTGDHIQSGELAPSASRRQPLIELLGTSTTNEESGEAATRVAAASLPGNITNKNYLHGRNETTPVTTATSSPADSPFRPLNVIQVPTGLLTSSSPQQQNEIVHEGAESGHYLPHKTIEEAPCCPAMHTVREEAFEKEPAFQYLRALALCHTVVCFDLPINPAMQDGNSGHHHHHHHHHSSSSKRSKRSRQKNNTTNGSEHNEREQCREVQQQQDSVTQLSHIGPEGASRRVNSKSGRNDTGRHVGSGAKQGSSNSRALNALPHTGTTTSDMSSYYYYLAERRKLREWRQQQLRHLKASHSILLSNPIRVPTAVAAGPRDEVGSDLLRQNSSSARQSHEPDDETGLFPFQTATSNAVHTSNSQPLFPVSGNEAHVGSAATYAQQHGAGLPTPREGGTLRLQTTSGATHIAASSGGMDDGGAAALTTSHIRFASETAIPTPQHGPTGSSSWYLHRYTTHVAHRRSLTLQMSGEHVPRMEQWIDRSKIYEGQSLDEIALVNAARDNGFCLVHRSAKQMFLRVLGKPMCYDIIAELEFTPQRKLMSILLRRNPADDVLTAEMQTGLGGIGGPRHYHRTAVSHNNNVSNDGAVRVPVVEEGEEGERQKKTVLWPAAQLPLHTAHLADYEIGTPKGLTKGGEASVNDVAHQSPLTDTNVNGTFPRLGTIVTSTTTTTTTTTTSSSGTKSHSVSEGVASPHDAHAATRQNTQIPHTPLSFGQSCDPQTSQGTLPGIYPVPSHPSHAGNVSEPQVNTTNGYGTHTVMKESTTEDNEKPYLLLVKGADSSMLEILDMSNPHNVELKRALIPQLDETASCGYRTLVLGQRYVSEAEVRQWLPILNDAQCSMQHRSDRLHEAYALMERDIDCIGTTAVEDKLQDGVPETLEFFLRASIVVWMLTGDKRETAVTIAHTAGLVSSAFPDTVCHLDITHIPTDNNNGNNEGDAVAQADTTRQDIPYSTSPFAATLPGVHNNGTAGALAGNNMGSNNGPHNGTRRTEEQEMITRVNNNNTTIATNGANAERASSTTLTNSSPLPRAETLLMSFGSPRTDSTPVTAGTGSTTLNQAAVWSLPDNSPNSPTGGGGGTATTNDTRPATESKKHKSVSFAPFHSHSRHKQSTITSDSSHHNHHYHGRHADPAANNTAGQTMDLEEQRTWAVLEEQLRTAEAMCARGLQTYGEKTIVLVVDGKTLDFIFRRDDRAHRFFLLASQCRSAVCCRMTPLQKAQIVRMFQRNMHAVALAVGDGANDVSMLQESKIGVGIMGLEGSQAELASDYAIPKFRFLKRLLFVHGRFSIYREAHCILYSLYKNVILTTGMAAYSFYTGYSGQMFIDSWLLSLFSLLFCSLQPIMIGILDKDVEDELAETLPQLYPPLAKESMYFSLGYIMKWLFDGFVEGLVFFFILIYTIGVNDDLFGTRTGGIDDYGQVFFTMLVLVADLRAGITVTYYMILFALALVIELAAVPAFEFAYGAIHNVLGSNQSVFIANNIWASSKFWLLLFFAIGVFVVYTVASNLYIQLFAPWKNSGLAMQAMRRSRYYQEHQLAKLNMAQEVAKRLAIQKKREEVRRRQHEDRRRNRAVEV